MDSFFDQLEQTLKRDIPLCMSTAIEQAVPIWVVLGLTEEEYNLKYNPIPEFTNLTELLVADESSEKPVPGEADLRQVSDTKPEINLEPQRESDKV